MLEIEEIHPDKPDTHVVLKEDDVISSSEAKWFRRELERIAGKNPQGGPILALRWAATYCDPMSTQRDYLKYVDFVDSLGRVFGERRWIIERWRSPEFLAHSGRYQITTRQDDDGTKLLKEIQPDGCYDYWLRLERANLTYHPLDNEALEVVRALWKWEQLPQNERDQLEQADREIERRQMIQFIRQQTPTRVHFGSGLIQIQERA